MMAGSITNKLIIMHKLIGNVPYVKVYKNGELQNPITDKYISEFPNRKTRRQRPKRFNNNRKTTPIVVFGVDKYYRRSRVVYSKNLEEVIIYDYIKR